ncbi:MAG: glutamyl-tRNA amidotransferase [Gammaproteobacteria bacterium GWE2_42_36]|nr:MAG: glutamyl-tRNA amidotransferase [Gammaproteobacteria bacterium GWE2_42_36]HCU05736.1 glutamyl-tRNA amidotransferase [Coxiellaceae bacterium]
MADVSIKQKLQDDMKEAMRARDQKRLDVIRFLLAAIKQKEVDERIVLDDAQTTAILEKFVKQRKDALEQFKAAGRDDLVAKENFELSIVRAYLPEPLSMEQVNALIKQAIKETSAVSVRDMGKVMTLLKPQLQGRADMGAVSTKIKELLSDLN